MAVTLDKFEYPLDVNAQAAWIAFSSLTGLIVLFKETDGAFIESSSGHLVLTNTGVAFTTATDFLKGGEFNGTSDYLYTPYNSALNPGTGDFYIGIRVRFSSLKTYSTILGQTMSGAMIVHLYDTRELYLGVGNAGYQSLCTLPASITDGNDHLIEICRVSGVVSMYYDQSAQSVTGASNTTDYTFQSAAAICIGSQNGVNYLGVCNVAEFAYIKGSGARILSQSTQYEIPPAVYSESTIKQSGSY